MIPKIAIIDYEMGNLFSVMHACKKVGLNSIITKNPEDIINCDAMILPGVGAFGKAMESLYRLKLTDTIKNFISEGKPFMGICLGFQLLFTESEEFKITKGLDVFNGTVRKFSNSKDIKIKIPQIGWNSIEKYSNELIWEDTPLNNIRQGENMYFVHSFYVEPKDESIKLTKTKYEEFEYCSSIYTENVFASQFHPEKSAKEGIKIYQNWADKIIEKIE